jgi:hypothetical protein
MALTSTQRSNLYRYLGWSSFGAGNFDSPLEQRLRDIAGRPEDEAMVVALLALCDGVMARIDDMATRWKVIKLGSIELRAHYELAGHRAVGRIYAGQLADRVGVEKRGDAFGPSRGQSGAWGASWNYPLHG